MRYVKITSLRKVHVDELGNGFQISQSDRLTNKRALGEIVDLACKYIQNNLLFQFKCKVHLFNEKRMRYNGYIHGYVI